MKFITTLMALAFTFTASAQTLAFFDCIGVSTVLPEFGGCCAGFTSTGVGINCALAGTTGSDPEYYCNPTILQDEPACCHYPSVTAVGVRELICSQSEVVYI